MHYWQFTIALAFLFIHSPATLALTPEYDIDWYSQCAHFSSSADSHEKKAITFCRNKDAQNGSVHCSLYTDLPLFDSDSSEARPEVRVTINETENNYFLKTNGFLYFTEVRCQSDGQLEIELSFSQGTPSDNNNGKGYRLKFPQFPK